MFQRFKEELTIKRQVGVRDPFGVPGVLVLTDPNPYRFTFELCRKPAQFGDVMIDQWWMPSATVYPQRKRSARNFQTIVDYYWALRLHHGTAIRDDVEDIFILANLLPLVRSNGGRRVFADSRPTRSQPGADLPTVAKELDHLLRKSRHAEMSELQFQEQTANALGPPDYGNELRDLYAKFASELLGPARAALQSEGEAGLRVAVEQWENWNRSIGRRCGKQLQKQVLDVLSYECRAALHTCYSAVWYELVQHLMAKEEMSDESAVFHRLWHLDPHEDSETPLLPNSRLFHGHVFALHPACANFMLTRTGCELIGEILADPSSKPAFHRLLNGLCIAIYYYAERNDVFALLRKKQPEGIGEEGFRSLEEQQIERRDGRRRDKPRPSDAR